MAKKYFILIFIVLAFILLIQKFKTDKKTINLEFDTQEPTTVIVHGTWFPGVSSYYYKMNCPLGLSKVTDLESDCLFYKSAQILDKQDHKEFNIENSYSFGWSGRLSFYEREKAAQELYNALIKYKRPITIIAHSHGCNVVLYLGKIAKENNNKDFVVDRLILLASPVQHNTKDLVNSEIFKEIYHFYSTKDWIQVLDPQGLYPENLKSNCGYFSCQRFNNSKVIECAVHINGHHLGHNEFWNEEFFKNLPQLLKKSRNIGQDDRNSLNLYNIKLSCP